MLSNIIDITEHVCTLYVSSINKYERLGELNHDKLKEIFDIIFNEVRDKTDIKFNVSMEKKIRIIGTRFKKLDLLVGGVVLEIETPKSFEQSQALFATDSEVEGIKQIIQYICIVSQQLESSVYIGYVTDGFVIYEVQTIDRKLFIKNRENIEKTLAEMTEKTKLREFFENLRENNIFRFEKYTLLTLTDGVWRMTEIGKIMFKHIILAVMELHKIRITPETFLEKFKIERNRAIIIQIWNILSDIIEKDISKEEHRETSEHYIKIRALFDFWKIIYTQLCGYKLDKIETKTRKKFISLLGVSEDALKKRKFGLESLMFAIHTYFAIIIKILALQLLSIHQDGRLENVLPVRRLLKYLESEKYELLRKELTDIEMGGIYRLYGFKNILEGDIYKWYIYLDDENFRQFAKTILNRILQKIEEFAISTTLYDPLAAKDFLKELYENLLPEDLRHDLGEYYTPDWLAEILINDVWSTYRMDEKLNKAEIPSILDPACGSGTFLVVFLRKILEHTRNRDIEFRKKIFREIIEKRKIVGFDINPLATITARLNYLLALGNLLELRRLTGLKEIEAPIYITDSIVIPYRFRELFGSPKRKGVELTIFLNEVEKLKEKIGMEYLEPILKVKELLIDPVIKEAILRQFLTVLEFRNSFDVVIGNPPWINWEHINAQYREKFLKPLHDVFLGMKPKGRGAGIARREISAIFVGVCVELYLRHNGFLSLLIPYTLFKMPAASGFRKFLEEKTKILKLYDFVELQPFGTVKINRTGGILLRKSGTPIFPLEVEKYTWKRKIPKEKRLFGKLYEIKQYLDRVKELCIRVKYGRYIQWIIGPAVLTKILSSQRSRNYVAHAGVYTGFDSIYIVRILTKVNNRYFKIAPSNAGDRKVEEKAFLIEKDLVYPLLRGRNVKEFKITKLNDYIVLPYDVSQKRVLSIPELKRRYPYTYKYFAYHYQQLIARRGQPYKSDLVIYHGKKLEDIEKICNNEEDSQSKQYLSKPFYYIFNIAEYLFRQYKIGWKYVAGAITGKAKFEVALFSSCVDDFLGDKIIIPKEKVMFISIDNKDEAFYLLAFLNSTIIKLIVSSVAIEQAIAPRIMEFLNIPKYDEKNEFHVLLSELGRQAYELALKKDVASREALKSIKERINKIVADIYGISDEDLEEIKRQSQQ